MAAAVVVTTQTVLLVLPMAAMEAVVKVGETVILLLPEQRILAAEAEAVDIITAGPHQLLEQPVVLVL